MIGASPAYFLSLFSPRFTPGHIESSLSELSRMGFQSLQLETFVPEQVDLFDKTTCARLKASIETAGLSTSQFVAHHLQDYFSSLEGFTDSQLISDFRRILSVAALVHPQGTLTIPQPAFATSDRFPLPSFSDLWSTYLDKLDTLRNLATEEGMALAVEVLPGSLLGNSDGFLRMSTCLGAPYIGINLDTGHAWACKENMALLPLKLKNYIYGTHISDNYSCENSSLRPGKGTIPWDSFFSACHMADYQGPFDVEIRCTPEEVEFEYSAAYQFLIQYTLPQLEV
ncbi:MAG: sugar phosphate isomerase/epimerase [Spirochaetia bacterium]